jgi:hypothetical protein
MQEAMEGGSDAVPAACTPVREIRAPANVIKIANLKLIGGLDYHRGYSKTRAVAVKKSAFSLDTEP